MLDVISDSQYFNDHYLAKCQVDTPIDIVEQAWKIAFQHRQQFLSVVDFGAGDGKFAHGGQYSNYVGYEIDSRRTKHTSLPSNAEIIHKCAFSDVKGNFDLCIGNPPYVRHHELNDEWQNKIANQLSHELGIRLDRRSNAFIYFLCQAILKTNDTALIVQVIPYEWVSRPSCSFLRKYVEDKKWTVKVYRFEQDVFAHSKVLTTASITVIDKTGKNGIWEFYTIDNQFNAVRVQSATGSNEKVLSYKSRSPFNYAQRGLSPGGQKIFCLTEEIRLAFKLKIGIDVVPCLTNIRPVPDKIALLNTTSFQKYLVNAGEKCWLITPTVTPSEELKTYLDSVSAEDRDTYTCRNQSPWWCYRAHPVPDLLYGSGFTKHGPKIFINEIGAVAVGAVHGIHKVKGISKIQLRKALRTFEFESRIVSHSGVLKKIEVNQMNSVIGTILNDT
ncbi:Eco57I restriction-modification methylase domain-containing protein [Rheinheimera mangrovi]|uniref:Eco57I restriction-modification methylase domain-containing protein n=1 Tax=Rheinheimera mangrovi TaxID=2498451 RepID=UPI000F8F4B9F|nr:Eco57I restriction-modification methylase domain-containing protein [Rheinheimera mangrovi]